MKGLWICLSCFFTCVHLDALRLPDDGSTGTWSHLLPAELDFDLAFQSNNPRNYECAHRSGNLTENLDDYAALFGAGYGKTLVMGGDSLMRQMVTLIECVSRELGLYVQSTGIGAATMSEGMIRIKRSQDAPDGTALVIQFRPYNSFSGIPSYINEPYRSLCKIPFDVLLQGAETYDYMFLNLGHHALPLPGSQGWTLEQVTDAIFTETKNHVAGRDAHIVWLGHPPSHFDSKDGSFPPTRSIKCNCNLDRQHLAQQCISKSDRIAKQLSPKYGFEYVSMWEDMVDHCDGHLQYPLQITQMDCTHYQLMPQLWTGVIRKITTIIKRSRQ